MLRKSNQHTPCFPEGTPDSIGRVFSVDFLIFAKRLYGFYRLRMVAADQTVGHVIAGTGNDTEGFKRYRRGTS
jgi:hypothetical protein